MAPREQLDLEIERLEGRLDRASDARAIKDLATVRRGLGSYAPGDGVLPNIRLAFACKERWDDMVGGDRVRACAGCDRPVFNLSEMTRAEAAAVLATRGLKPCVRFYRRPDGTVMTTDCPTGERRRGRRLAVIAAGATLAASPVALADAPAENTPVEGAPDTETPGASTDDPSKVDPCSGHPDDPKDIDVVMGEPIDDRYVMGEMGVIIDVPEPRPTIEWSVWTRLGMGIASQQPDVAARRVTTPPPMVRPTSISEAALAAELTFGIARHGNLRLGAWGEIRTTSDPVAGGELVLEGLAPHPYSSHIGGSGSLVVRAGGNDRIITGALGFGYVGSFPRNDPWIKWARHVVGGRVVVSMNRAIDDPHDWSATLGLEVEPLGVAHALYDLVTDHWH